MDYETTRWEYDHRCESNCLTSRSPSAVRCLNPPESCKLLRSRVESFILDADAVLSENVLLSSGSHQYCAYARNHERVGCSGCRSCIATSGISFDS